jgi:hypothetical protein
VLSAKHGLLAPDREIDSYDDSLKTRSSKDVQAWGRRVVSKLATVTSTSDLIFVLAGSTYTDAIVNRLKNRAYRVAQPLEGMSIGRRLQWLNAARGIEAATADLEAFYEILNHLASNTGGLQLLAEADQRKWPDRGVYFFFEPGERRFASDRPRVVRVGTHAVSANSKATLWNRLRTHRGVGDGGGNHRSSIFRSHVGTAILHRDSRVGELPDWGNQSAGDQATKSLEASLERLVSTTICQMRILCVEVRDEAGPRSDRAFLERNAISLLSTVGAVIDRPSRNWLGNSSPHPAINKSGLWNVNYVAERSWDPEFLEVFDYYARATIGEIPFVNRSIAPPGWWNRGRSRSQINFPWYDDDHDAK